MQDSQTVGARHLIFSFTSDAWSIALSIEVGLERVTTRGFRKSRGEDGWFFAKSSHLAVERLDI